MLDYEFKNIYLAIFGVLTLLVWAKQYWYIGKKPELFYPGQFSKGKSLKGILFIIGVIGWISISIALMGPRKAKEYTETNIEVSDIFFAVDVSLSMKADDFKPNRLEVAKQRIAEFVDLRPKDRIGIVTFAENVYTLLPLSTDLKLIKQIIGEIRIGPLGSATNIGDAVALAVARSAKSDAKRKTIILLTDGVNTAGNIEPMVAAQQAKDFNIKVYTIGVGSDKDARIPVGKGFFGTQYQRIPGGSIDYKLLADIARLTGGETYKATDEAALANVLKEIEKLERTKIKIQGQVAYDEYFFIFLLIGGLLVLMTELCRKLILREVL